MSPIVNARPGYVNYAETNQVAASQTIRKGDLIKYDAAKRLVKAAVGDAGLLGVATHSITTGATITERDLLVVDVFTQQSIFRGTVKNGTTYDRATLINTAAGFIDEGGELRIDLAAAVKQAVIVDIVNRNGVTTTKDPLEVFFAIPAVANRTR